MKKLNEMRRTEPYTLIGCDGNAFAVIGYVQRAMRECGKTREEISGYAELAKQGDYNNLLCVSMEELEQLNDELGFDENAQIDDIYESKKTSKKSKKLNEEDEYYDNMHYEIKKVLNNAISDALIKIWDECSYEFTKEEAKEMLHAAVDNF